jgi:hypothetical protein
MPRQESLSPDLARLVRQTTLQRQHRVPEGGEVIEYRILGPVEALEQEGQVHSAAPSSGRRSRYCC